MLSSGHQTLVPPLEDPELMVAPVAKVKAQGTSDASADVFHHRKMEVLMGKP